MDFISTRLSQVWRHKPYTRGIFTTSIVRAGDTKTTTVIHHRIVVGYLSLLPNQSLKLTEPAVDDFAARCWTDLSASDWNVRATSYLAAAVRRRSLAPVR